MTFLREKKRRVLPLLSSRIVKYALRLVRKLLLFAISLR